MLRPLGHFKLDMPLLAAGLWLGQDWLALLRHYTSCILSSWMQRIHKLWFSMSIIRQNQKEINYFTAIKF